MNEIVIIHKKRYFWTSIFKIQEYVELMQKEGYKLEIVDNQVYYWSENKLTKNKKELKEIET